METNDNIVGKIGDIRSFIIEWNNRFPFDRLYRRKYNIAFGSEAHLNISQIDVYLDCAEDRIFENLYVDFSDAKIREERYENGEIFRQTKESEELISELFDNISIDQFNNNNG